MEGSKEWTVRNAVRRKQRGLYFAGAGTAAVLFACVLFAEALSGCQADRAMTLEWKESGAQGEAGGGEDARTDGAKEGSSGDGEETAEARIFVHVCGAVRDPGLKELPAGSRVFDALELAGGFAEDADEAAVNLAGFLKDGQQLYFPAVGEQVQSAAAEGKLDLNQADEAALRSLPGIGESRAKAICQYRREHGDFTKVEELMQVPGIKEAIYLQIKDLVTVQ